MSRLVLTLTLAFSALAMLAAPSASALDLDSLMAVSSQVSVRALAVSEPPPPPPPPPITDGRVIIAPTGAAPGEQFGNSVASAGDVNGDGYPDLIVGSWTSDLTTGDAGAAFVYFGGPSADAVPDLVLRGQSFDDNFGTSVASAGDMNGDGYDDVIVGAWRATSTTRTGRAYVFFGGPTPNADADLVLAGEAPDDHFGVSVAGGGDLNGDGFADVVIGASGYGFGRGRAYVYFGGTVPNTTVDLRVSGESVGDGFGFAVACGDWDGDGHMDFLVGSPQANGMGKGYLYRGGPSLDATADRIFSGEALGDNFGTSVASAGDVDGDGVVDLIVGAHMNDVGGSEAGRAYVYHGGPSLDATPDLVLTGFAAGDRFGQSVSGAGDMNGDGFDDVIVGAWLSDARAPDAGSAYVYYMGPVADSNPDMTLAGENADDRFGISVAGLGDFNHAAGPEVVVGAYFNDAAGGDAGRAYVFTADLSQAPVVVAPASVSSRVGSAIAFDVTASDPDGDPIQALVIDTLPSGATFSPNITNTVGSFRWTPTDIQVGDYTVTFTASNNQSGRASTRITVASLNDPPTLSPVADMTVDEGSAADQVLQGSDPDSDPLTFSLASGPGFASVTTATATTGNLHLAPGFTDAGSYAATVRVSDGRGGTASASLNVHVNQVNRPPVLSGPAGVFGAEGMLLSITITASDPDGDHVTLGAVNRPVGSLFVDNGNGSGAFSWTPGYGQAGTYAITFTGRDDFGATASRTLSITVDDVNRGPVAVAGGPYTGVVQVPIVFNGTGSSDPDGNALSYHWDFGDLATASVVTPSHAYAAGGTFVVTLAVDDGMVSASSSTIATIQDVFPARVFTTNANRVIRLGSGKASWCVEIEPTGSSFLETAVVASTIRARFGTRQILARAADVNIGADKDANGVAELTACFSKADLRTLFTGLPKGTSTVSVTLEGDLNTGGTIRGIVTVDVVNSGGMAASIWPNPLNPTGTLTVATTRGGWIRAYVFDLGGRRVRTLEPGVMGDAGYHEFLVDGRNDRGDALPSGAYFYRVETAEGAATGRFVIVK